MAGPGNSAVSLAPQGLATCGLGRGMRGASDLNALVVHWRGVPGRPVQETRRHVHEFPIWRNRHEKSTFTCLLPSTGHMCYSARPIRSEVVIQLATTLFSGDYVNCVPCMRSTANSFRDFWLSLGGGPLDLGASCCQALQRCAVVMAGSFRARQDAAGV